MKLEVVLTVSRNVTLSNDAIRALMEILTNPYPPILRYDCCTDTSAPVRFKVEEVAVLENE